MQEFTATSLDFPPRSSVRVTSVVISLVEEEEVVLLFQSRLKLEELTDIIFATKP